MTKNLFLDFLREVRRSANRFISILCIVSIGVAFFAGLRSSAPDMAYTMDKYYDEHNIMDVQIASTLGLTPADIEAIRNIPGVEKVQPGYFTDVLTSVDGMEMVFRVHSLPANYLMESDSCINQVTVVEGHLPQAANEIVIEKSLNLDVNLNVGDTLVLRSGTDEALTDGVMHSDTYTVVGKVTTPYYLTYEKGTSQISGMSIALYAYVLETAFDYEDLGIYIDALVTATGARELNAFDSKYAKQINELKNAISNIGVDRAVIRGNELRGGAMEQLEDAQKQYDEGLEEFNTQISEAQAQLDEAYTQLLNGESDLKTGQERFELEIKNAQEKIADGEKQLASAAQSLATGREQLATAQAQFNSAKSQYQETLDATATYRARLKDLEGTLGELSTTLEQLNNTMNGIEDPELRAQYAILISVTEELYNSTRQERDDLKRLNKEMDDSIVELDGIMAESQKALDDATKQMNEAQAEYNAGQAQLAAGKAELASKKAEAEKQLADGRKQLDEGWEEYEDGKVEFEWQREQGQRQLDSAYAQLTEAKYQIERIENAEWYVLDRTMNYGFNSYKSTVDRMRALSGIIPVFFILVAVLVCMTTMTRMVSEQRGIIGTYKALGYDDNAIASKYVLYVVAASLVGAVIGAALGTKLFPSAVYNAWAAMYSQPPLEQKLRWGEIAISFAVTIVAMAFTAYYTSHNELQSVPAQLMRPKSPKLGKAILLEKIGFIWNHLNFSQKVTMRNIFRYKKRLAMTIIGILGCSALLVSGLGMNDTISAVVSNQYEKIFQNDLVVSTDSEKDARSVLRELDGKAAEGFCIGVNSVTISNDNGNEIVTMYIPEDVEGMKDYIRLQTRVGEKPLELDGESIIISEKLAEQLKVKVGDFLNVIDSTNMKKTVPVSGITENYVFHYAYMSADAFTDYFQHYVPQSEVLVKLTGSEEENRQMVTFIENLDGVTSITNFMDLAASFGDQISAMKSITYLIIVCAMLLAFVVLYNLTNINVSERMREIATIKVLGFKGNEVAMYIYRENFIMTIMGAVIGLFFGQVLHRIIIKAIEQNNIMFGYKILPFSYVESVALTCLFSILVMVYMYRKLVNIPMVESLKSVE